MASALTDAVVDDARRGEAAALTAIYESIAPGILAYLRGRGSWDAEGLTQEVFTQLLPQLRKVSGGAAGVKALAFTIAHSRLVDEFRRRQRGPEMPYDSELDGRKHGSAEDEVIRLGFGAATALLTSISDEQRTVILLRILGDLSLDETARIIGKSVGAVKQLQRRGLLALREQLDQQQARR